jgi:hypothetical protein
VTPNTNNKYQVILTLPSLPTPATLPSPFPLPLPKGEPRRRVIRVTVSEIGSDGRGAAIAVVKANAAMKVLERMMDIWKIDVFLMLSLDGGVDTT